MVRVLDCCAVCNGGRNREKGETMRLIDADRMIKDIKENYVIYGYADFLNDFFRMVEEQPTVDAEPVRHGRWMKNGDRYCECSVCHHEGNMSGQDSYCWNCGANMDAPTQKSVDNALEALDEVEE